MKSACRRKRRDNPSRSRKSSSRRAVQALAAGAAIAAGTQAYADPIRFDNLPGAEHFDWVPADPGDQTRWLDVAVAASEQPGSGADPAAFRQHFGTSGVGGQVQGGGTGMGAVQIGGPYGVFLLGVDSGELIPSGLPWGGEGYVYYPGFGSQLPEGVATYLGARFDAGAGNQYAWIGVVRTGDFVDAFAWGYETDPGVPIAAGAPEPGTLALLAFGACAAASRRRRSQLD